MLIWQKNRPHTNITQKETCLYQKWPMYIDLCTSNATHKRDSLGIYQYRNTHLTDVHTFHKNHVKRDLYTSKKTNERDGAKKHIWQMYIPHTKKYLPSVHFKNNMSKRYVYIKWDLHNGPIHTPKCTSDRSIHPTQTNIYHPLHTATHCQNCNTLQRTAAHCNTPAILANHILGQQHIIRLNSYIHVDTYRDMHRHIQTQPTT